ncbi:SGNH/GDSL hydrolase family protein [Actinoplanes sp. CA-030573]|uniref:SGNH/GDSL hydrolase family protein n=1 Tax=Actinoplanes sp. CA-030573 TaxID=3239898 RepID=UPI003D8CA36C
MRLNSRRSLLAGVLSLVAALGPATAAAADEPAPGTNGVLRVMPLGDSITFGKGDPAENGYRAELYDRLSADGARVEFVGSQHNGTGVATAHEGHPGWRIAQLTERIDGWMAESRPDVVLLDIGTNDLLHRDHVAAAPDRLIELIDHIVAADPAVRIVLADLLVVDRGHETDFLNYNTAVGMLAGFYPDNVTPASMSGIPVENTVDHVHPNALGYRQMAEVWYEALRG